MRCPERTCGSRVSPAAFPMNATTMAAATNKRGIGFHFTKSGPRQARSEAGAGHPCARATHQRPPQAQHSRNGTARLDGSIFRTTLFRGNGLSRGAFRLAGLDGHRLSELELWWHNFSDTIPALSFAGNSGSPRNASVW
jgi:hypothetical protein